MTTTADLARAALAAHKAKEREAQRLREEAHDTLVRAENLVVIGDMLAAAAHYRRAADNLEKVHQLFPEQRP